MGKFYDEIPRSHFAWIKKQNMFWVATAPLNAQGHINVSPKGTADCFHVVNSNQVWYEDLTGSGVETISHVRENGRITIMFCAFQGPPRIMRLFGVGTVHEYGSPEYNKLILPTSRKPGSRAVIFIDVYKVGTSCGYAVPLYDFVMHRTHLGRLSNKLENGDRALAAARDQHQQQELTPATVDPSGDDKKSTPTLSIRAYWLSYNMRSLDGLTGLVAAPDAVLSATPQCHFDENSPRPKPRGNTPVTQKSKELQWLASGFALGAASTITISILVGALRSWQSFPHRSR